MRLLARASLRHLTGHRLQLLLSILGVALGVAIVLSIDLAIQSARTGFRISAETVAGRATHAVSGELEQLPEGLFTQLRTELDLTAAPVVEGYASSTLLPGRALRVLGIDPLSEGPFRPWVAGGPNGLDVGPFVTTRRGAVLTAGLAAEAGLAPGDTLPIMAEGIAWALPIVATVAPGDELARAGLADVILMDVAGAQEVLRTTGLLSRIDLRVEEGAEGDARVAAVKAMLPAGVTVEPVGTRSATMSGMIAAFDVNLTALSLLGLIFGMFLIYNSMTFSVVQRRQILGRLRTMGVTRGEVIGTILREAVWIGAVGAVVGVLVGVLLARGLVGMVTGTINDLYFAVTVQQLDLDPWLVAKAFTLGLGATVLAALPPALEAGSANPRLASLRSVVESRVRRLVPRAAVLGAMLGVLGAGILTLPTRSLAVSFTGLFCIITGMALATPWATLVLVSGLRPALRAVGGTLGVMAGRGVGAGLSRTAPAIAALVVAVSVTVGLGVMIDSFRGTLTDWLDGTLRADVYVSLPGPTASRATGTLWPDVIDAFVAHPDVVGFSTYRGIDVVGADDAYRLVALRLDPRGEGAFDFVDGNAEEAMRRFREGRAVIVSEPFAFRRGLAREDEVRIEGRRGTESLPIAGVFYDYGSEQGTVMMDRAVYDRLFVDDGVTSLGLFLRDGADSDAVVAELLGRVPGDRTVVARTNDTLRAASLEVFDRTFRVTAVLRMLAFIVAFVGVLSGLAALQLERARELGMLRAAGMTPRQLWQLVVTQTGLIGLVAGLLAIPMGILLSIVMIFVVNKRSFGWTLDMQIAPEVLAQAVGLALAGALLAGLYPAWKMARTSPALALRGE